LVSLEIADGLVERVTFEKLGVIEAGFPSDEAFLHDLRHKLQFRARKDTGEISMIYAVFVEALEQSLKCRMDIGCTGAGCEKERCYKKEYAEKEPFHRLSGLPPRADFSLTSIF
jgi:hypothetical protein